MMQFGLGLVDLSAQEVAALERRMAHNHQIFVQAAKQLLGSSDPADIKRLRTMKVPAYVAKAIVETWGLAETACRQFIRTVVPLISSYHFLTASQCNGLEEDDFVQEAYVAIIDAAFCYDGSTCFSTFIYKCVKHHLGQCQHRELKAGSIRTHVRRLGKSVTALLRKGLSPAMAHALVGQGQSGPVRKTPEDEENENEAESEEAGAWDESLDPEEAEHIRRLQLQAIALAPLNPLERGIMNAYMRGEKEIGEINPATGKPYSRQGILNAFKSAREKVRRTYASLVREAAA